MNRKKFLAAFGVLSGSTITGLGKHFPAERAFKHSNLQGNESDIWKIVREEFSFPEGYVYLNTGGIGSVPRHVRSLVSDEWFQLEANPAPGHDLNRWNALKNDVAILLGSGVDSSEIGLISSATEGINIISNGLPLQKDDEVITTLHEHPALNIPLLNQLKRKGVVIRTFDPDRKIGLNNVKIINDLINKKTKLIFVSHRTTTTGQLLPVKEIGNLAKSRGIWFALDGAQAPGSMPIDIKEWNVDFYTFSSHKWILAPRRTGVLYVTKDKLDIVAPITVGAYSDNGYNIKEGKLNFQPSAQRYEYGTQNELLFLGFHASLKFMNALGLQKIRDHNETLSEKFYSEISKIEGCELLSPSEREYRSSMITFRVPGKTLNDVMGELAKDNIHVRPVGEADLNGVRVSFHIYNDENDLDKAIESIKKIVKN
jgi:cysteine desulfurase / selenocysteine lyase